MAACAVALPAFSANDPFAGTWKLNQAKSMMKGQTEVIKSLGENKYRFTYGTTSFDIKADGTDQPAFPGSSMAVTIKDPNTWEVVNKTNGITTSTGTWVLSKDGKTISAKMKSNRPDGSETDTNFDLKRISGSGFAGTWEMAGINSSSPGDVQISAYGTNGLTISFVSDKVTTNLTMDGKDCVVEGPTVPKGSTTSASRPNAHTVKMTDKLNGKVTDTEEWKLSADGKSFTLTHHDAGVPKPMIFVYERQ